MHDEILAPGTRRALAGLSEWTAKRGFYLAGGTGCALHLGHRVSQDLDFFTPEPIEPLDVQKTLDALGLAVADYTDAGTWVGNFDGVKAGFFHYSPGFIAPLSIHLGTRIASIEDIGCMKIEAVAGRGKKRDFVDLAFILKSTEMDLGRLLEFHQKKYGPERVNIIHLLKSLAYFDDAEGDPDPVMLIPFSWTETKEFLRTEIRRRSL